MSSLFRYDSYDLYAKHFKYSFHLDIWSHENEYQENIKQLIRTPEISKNTIKEAILWIRWEETKKISESPLKLNFISAFDVV